MNDTDKYEGHTPAPWDELLSVGVEDQQGWDALLELGFNDEARQLIADAPVLLAEVKVQARMISYYRKVNDYLLRNHPDIVDDMVFGISEDDNEIWKHMVLGEALKESEEE